MGLFEFFKVPEDRDRSEIQSKKEKIVEGIQAELFQELDRPPKNRDKKNSKARRKTHLRARQNPQAPSIHDMDSIWDGDEITIPKEVGERLHGKSMSYNKLRRSIRSTMYDLAKALMTPENQEETKNGRAPYAPPNKRYKGRTKMELDHIIEIHQGGHPTHLKNLRAITPKDHTERHSNDGCYNSIQDIIDDK